MFVGASDGFVYGFNDQDGSLAWSYKTPNGGFATLAARDGTVYAAGGTDGKLGKLFALDAASGQRRWQVDAPDGLGFRSPSVDANNVYIATRRRASARPGDCGWIRAMAVLGDVSGRRARSPSPARRSCS